MIKSFWALLNFTMPAVFQYYDPAIVKTGLCRERSKHKIVGDIIYLLISDLLNGLYGYTILFYLIIHMMSPSKMKELEKVLRNTLNINLNYESTKRV